jgi:hypothetical protein
VLSRRRCRRVGAQLNFLKGLVISAAIVGGAALALGRAGFVWQRAHVPEGYWLLPVNLPSFYFLPLFAIVAWALARGASRPSGWLLAAAIGGLVFTAWRVAFWKGVAIEFGGHPTVAQIESVWSQPHGVLVGAFGFFVWVALAAGIRRAARRPLDSHTVVATSERGAG